MWQSEELLYLRLLRHHAELPAVHQNKALLGDCARKNGDRTSKQAVAGSNGLLESSRLAAKFIAGPVIIPIASEVRIEQELWDILWRLLLSQRSRLDSLMLENAIWASSGREVAVRAPP